MSLHVYVRGHQPATRYSVKVDMGGRDNVGFKEKRLWFRNKSRATVPTSCCRKRRWAAHCTVQVYYDMIPFWCRAGRGCKVPKHRAPRSRTLLREFQAGTSFVGLARKYAMTTLAVQAAVRRVSR